MGTKNKARIKQKLLSFANRSQQKQEVEVEEENNQINFRVGPEYSISQLTLYSASLENFQKILDDHKQVLTKKGWSEEEIKAFTFNTKERYNKLINSDKHHIQNLISKLEIHQELFSSMLIENHYQDRADYEGNRRLLALNMEDDIQQLPKRYNDLEDIRAEIDVFTEELDGKNPAFLQSFIHNRFAYGFLLFFLAGGDAVLIFNNIAQLSDGIQNSGILWLTSLLALSVMLCSHFLGEAIANKKVTKQLSLSIASSFLFLLGIIWLRLEVKSSLVLAAFNLSFFSIGTLISYMHNIKKSFWKTVTRIKKLKKQFHALYSEVLFNQKRKDLETNAITIAMRSYAKEAALSDIIVNEQAKTELENACDGLEKVRAGLHSEIESIERIALAKISRKESAKNWFTKPFANLATRARALFFSVSLGLFLGSCTSDIQVSDIAIILDLTEQEQALPDAKTLRNVVGDIEAGTIVFDVITDRYSNVFESIKLDEPLTFLNQTREIEDARKTDFDSVFSLTYKSLDKPISEPKQSLVFATLSDNLIRLSNSSAQDKRVLLFSDMLNFKRDGINLYQYRKNPKKLMQDSDQIISYFKSEYDPKNEIDLRGVKITVYNLPKKKNDALYRSLKQFYTKMLKEEYTAEKIEFVPFVAAKEDQ